jgi:hypothetical protein
VPDAWRKIDGCSKGKSEFLEARQLLVTRESEASADAIAVGQDIRSIEMMHFANGRHLAAARTMAGLTQVQLAQLAGLGSPLSETPSRPVL